MANKFLPSFASCLTMLGALAALPAQGNWPQGAGPNGNWTATAAELLCIGRR